MFAFKNFVVLNNTEDEAKCDKKIKHKRTRIQARTYVYQITKRMNE